MKLLAVDGNSLINRAFYGIRLLTTKEGVFTNGVYGFITMLNRIIEMEKPDGVAVAFDLRKPTFRHELYKEYKAGRKGMPDELASQMPLLKEWLTLMGYSVLEVEGFEADDILGTLASLSEESGNSCFIATGDRDSFQLVSDNVTVLNTVTKGGHPEIIRYDTAAIIEKYGVQPKQMLDIKALQGDASDNIPGVAGVGEKTAGSLIAEFGSIENIYNNIENIDIKATLKAKLLASKDNAFLSYTLGKIRRDVPISRNLSDYLPKERNDKELAKFMTKLEFFSLMEKMGITATAPEETQEEKSADYIVADFNTLETNDLCHVVCENGQFAVAYNGKVALIPSEKVKDFLENDCKKDIYNCKEVYKLFPDTKNVVFDSMLAGYLCSPSAKSYELSRLAAEYSATTPTIVGDDNSILFAAATACEVSNKLLKEVKDKNFTALLNDIELPLSKVLAAMENVGFLVDIAGIKEMGRNLGESLKNLESEIYTAAGCEFNINSPKQLGEVLFEKLMLPCKKKTKSGYSTNAEVLESLVDEHPVIELILEYRKLGKLKSTYCDGLVSFVEKDGRIRSTLNQTETRTGRISSLEPNLQNIPVRTREGKELRRFFKATEGYTLIDADYSQIELRVLAHIADDEIMKEAFLSGADIHLSTAASVFGLPQNMVTPIMRSRAKAVNFGIVYGIGAFSLAKDIGVTRKEASDYIKGYMQNFSGVAEYMDKVVADAKENGYVVTLFGRRRYLPELTASNGMLRAFGERVARNMPIQGTAADIIKIAMVKVHERLLKENLDARIIMQVHDELIIEAKEDIAEYVAKLLRQEMENACKLSVPLIADTSIGKTWYDAKG